MYPTIFKFTDTLAIQTYGVAIACGLIGAFTLAERDIRRSRLITLNNLEHLTFLLVASALIGGRIWHFITERDGYESWFELLVPWMGGFSVMGSTITAVAIGAWYVHARKLPLWKLLDLVGVYAPLIQAFGRIGCFFAGCCFGCATTVSWAIIYTHPDVFAPRNIPLHPAQLYSAAIFFMLFFALWRMRNRSYLPGTVGLLYLMGAATERFIVDFWRGDRIMGFYLSVNQWAALLIFMVATGVLIYRKVRHGSISVS